MASGKSVYGLLMRVCHAYLSVFFRARGAIRGQRSGTGTAHEELVNGMDAISSRITAETESAESGLARAMQAYFPQMPVPKEPQDDGAFKRIEQNLSQVDGALLQLRQLTNQLQSTGSRAAGARMLDGLEPLVKALQMPLYEAKWKLGMPTRTWRRGEARKALGPPRRRARFCWAEGRPGLSSFAQSYEAGAVPGRPAAEDARVDDAGPIEGRAGDMLGDNCRF